MNFFQDPLNNVAAIEYYRKRLIRKTLLSEVPPFNGGTSESNILAMYSYLRLTRSRIRYNHNIEGR